MTSGAFSLADRDYILEQLRTKILEVDFTKRNGEKRTMTCTLREEHLPKKDKIIIDLTKPAPKKRDNPELITVFDIEVKDWRSFRLDSIDAITIRSTTP